MQINLTMILCLLVFIPSLSYAATAFFADDKFTQNGIEWCEENFQLYQITKEAFFEHHKHSIESRICVSLYEDPLWTYNEPDRYEKLIEQSAYYVQLEIAESKEEAQTGIIDVMPAENPVEETLSESIEEKTMGDESLSLTEKNLPYNEEKTSEGGGCLIATATFGSELAPQVQLLREVRDNTLLSTSSGASFMSGFNSLYYSFSPVIADIERENPIFRQAVKLFITPMLSTLSIMTLADEGSESQVLGFGISVIILNLGMYVAGPAMIIRKISNLK